MTLYKKRYRVETTRLKNWDYSGNGWYFVTICTHKRLCHFGEIIMSPVETRHAVSLPHAVPLHPKSPDTQSLIRFTPVGEMAYRHWSEIPDHFDHVDIDAFVIMPNHVHGIIVIGDAKLPVETRHAVSLRESGNANQFSNPTPNSLPTIIRSYKSAVTKWSGENGSSSFAWQSRYHDRIIRDEGELNRVRKYIYNNPLNWQQDDFYPRERP